MKLIVWIVALLHRDASAVQPGKPGSLPEAEYPPNNPDPSARNRDIVIHSPSVICHASGSSTGSAECRSRATDVPCSARHSCTPSTRSAVFLWPWPSQTGPFSSACCG